LKCFVSATHYRMKGTSQRLLASVAGTLAMRIEVRTNRSSVAVVDLAGKLTAGAAIACLHDNVGDLLRRNFTNIVLNMQSVDLVDCAGIGQMVNCLCQAREQGGNLKLVHAHRRLRELLVLFRLESVLETLESEQAAIASITVSHAGAPAPQKPVRANGERVCWDWGQL